MADRKYDDKEVGQILNAAAEMESGMSTLTSGDGITLTELQRIAEEVGINPDNVERAATALSVNSQRKSQRRSGSVMIESRIDGVISEDIWDELITEVQRFAGKPGSTLAQGPAREWTGTSSMGSLMFSATTRNGSTRLKILGDSGMVTATTIPLGIASGMLTVLVPFIVAAKVGPGMSPYVATALAVLIAAVIATATYLIIQAYRNKLAVQLDALLDRLIEISRSGLTGPVERLRIGPTRTSGKEANNDVARLDGQEAHIVT